MRRSSLAVVGSASILLLTATATLIGALGHGPLVTMIHPIFPGTYQQVMLVAAIVEFAVLLGSIAFGQRIYLTCVFSLGAMFVAYHCVYALDGIARPSSCLGGLVNVSRLVERNEANFSLILSLLLMCFGAPEFFKNASTFVVPAKWPNGSLRSRGVLLSLLLWLAGGLTLAYKWRNYLLDGDESTELAKAILALKHPELLTKMWNDQPFALTAYLRALFHVTGVSLSWARLSIVLMGTLIPLTLSLYFSQHGYPTVGIIAVVLFWITPDLPIATTAVIQEVAAQAVAIGAALPLLLLRKGGGACVLSGIMAGVSLHMKFTACFGLLLAVSLVWQSDQRVRDLAVWLATLLGCWFLGVYISPHWSMAEMYTSHVSSPPESQASSLSVNIPSILFRSPLAGLCLTGSLVLFTIEPCKRLLFPLIAGVGVAAILHCLHVPWWNYYSLHFWIFGSYLAGFAAWVAVVWVAKIAALGGYRGLFLAPFCGILLAAALIATVRDRVTAWTAAEEDSINVQCGEVALAVRQYANLTKWSFSYSPIEFCLAGLCVPPEVTVVPKKRMWAGYTEAEIVGVVRTYDVEQIALRRDAPNDPLWSALLTNYVLVAQDSTQSLYVTKRLHPTPLHSDKARTIKILQRYGF